ncbi:hypothetical protein KWH73_21770, partial [Enterobacter roggenkampii]
MFTTPARRIARGATVGLGGAALAFGVAVVPVAPAEAAAAPGTEINLVTYNDFHGALSVGEEFACTVVDEQAQHENSFLISGGDNVGGSEFASAIQDDEPTRPLSIPDVGFCLKKKKSFLLPPRKLC